MMKTGRHRKVNKRIAAGDVAEFGTPRKHTRMTEMDKLRMFVNERLTAAAEDIVGVFGETIAQYRAEIDRQRKELEKLRPKVKQQTSEPSASVENGCGSNGGSMPFTDPVSVRHQSSGISSQRMKVEPDVEDSDPARDPEPGSEGQPLSPEPGSEGQPLSPEPGSEGQPLSPDCSESRAEDSDEDWKETRGRRKPAKTTNRIKGVSPALLPDISCKVCGESFRTAALLAAHADRHANDCGVCGKRLETGDDIRRHLQLHKDKPYCCSLCSQSYANVHNLRIHLLVHSGLKPYACTVCNKRFARKGSLVRHVRTHSGEKRFGCPFCGRAFLEKANMKVHLRIHTGERPYWCSSCDRHFIQQSCFDRHACRRKRTLKGTDSHIQTTQ